MFLKSLKISYFTTLLKLGFERYVRNVLLDWVSNKFALEIRETNVTVKRFESNIVKGDVSKDERGVTAYEIYVLGEYRICIIDK